MQKGNNFLERVRLGEIMHNRKDRGFSIHFIILVILFFGILPGCKKNTQPEVVLYCSVDQSIAEPIIAEFEKESGIKVHARFDTEASKTVGLIQKIRAESASPVADVFWSNEIFYTIRMAREGLLSPYNSETTSSHPKRFCDVNEQWYGFALRARVIGYNTQKVSADEAPKSLEDLLDAKWRGRIVLASPEFGTTGGGVASWFAFYGDQEAERILQALKANETRLVEGNSTAVRMIATGQADICLTDSDDIYAGIRNGWPVAMNYLDQKGAGCLAIPNTAAVIKGAPHQQEAEVLMEFLLSEKLERMLSESDSHNWPVNTKLQGDFEKYRIDKILDLEYEKIADKLPEAIKRAREILE
jgi:iron(III) transport system substrate-binding protein